MHYSTTPFVCLAALVSGCGAQATPADSDMQNIYVSVRTKAAEGNIAEAAKLTDDPAAFTQQMTQARDQLGEDKYRALMTSAANNVDVDQLASSGNYGVLILNAKFNGRLVKAATFFVERDGKMLEMVRPSGVIPCDLYATFYAAKGEPDAEPSSCS